MQKYPLMHSVITKGNLNFNVFKSTLPHFFDKQLQLNNEKRPRAIKKPFQCNPFLNALCIRHNFVQNKLWTLNFIHKIVPYALHFND